MLKLVWNFIMLLGTFSLSKMAKYWKNLLLWSHWLSLTQRIKVLRSENWLRIISGENLNFKFQLKSVKLTSSAVRRGTFWQTLGWINLVKWLRGGDTFPRWCEFESQHPNTSYVPWKFVKSLTTLSGYEIFAQIFAGFWAILGKHHWCN